LPPPCNSNDFGYKQVLYRFQSLQFSFSFIASALVSALLSWSIVRPLNYLGAFSRRYATLQDSGTLPIKLLARGDELGDLNALCRQVIDNMAVSFPATPIHLSASNNIDIAAYPKLLQQAFDNIIGNACKYSPRDKPVEITMTEHKHNVNIAVRDFGPGVDESEMSTLLQPFYRAENQMHTSGFGLDLSIALKAINKHHGE
jgi:signal transduction histidine kinase